MKDSRAKGNRFMQQCCKDLTRWVDPRADIRYQAGLPFRVRSTSITPVEGHWQGRGDILWRPDLDFAWCVECKVAETWSLDGLWNPKWPIRKWWEQCTSQTAKSESDLRPLLIFGRNRMETLVMVSVDDLDVMGVKPTAAAAVGLVVDGETVTILRFKDFVDVCRPLRS